MCMSSPKIEEPDPVPTFEQARPEDEEMTARRDERKRLKQAFNSRSTILSDNGRKTLLGV